MQQNSEIVNGGFYGRHVVYLLPGGMDRLEDIAAQMNIVSSMHKRVTVSGMMRLVCSGHLRIVRGRRFYGITQEDSEKYGVDRWSLLQRRIQY